MAGEPELDLRAELARIDRDRAETQKLFEESRKLDAERRHQTWQPMAIAVLALVASIFALVMARA